MKPLRTDVAIFCIKDTIHKFSADILVVRLSLLRKAKDRSSILVYFRFSTFKCGKNELLKMASMSFWVRTCGILLLSRRDASHSRYSPKCSSSKLGKSMEKTFSIVYSDRSSLNSPITVCFFR